MRSNWEVLENEIKKLHNDEIILIKKEICDFHDLKSTEPSSFVNSRSETLKIGKDEIEEKVLNEYDNRFKKFKLKLLVFTNWITNLFMK